MYCVRCIPVAVGTDRVIRYLNDTAEITKICAQQMRCVHCVAYLVGVLCCFSICSCIYESCKLALVAPTAAHCTHTHVSRRHKDKLNQYINMGRFVYHYVFGFRCLCSLSASRHIVVVVRVRAQIKNFYRALTR